MAFQKCRSSAVTIVANVWCMLTTLESGWLCSECFIYLILLHTHNNPARMGNISPVFQVKKQAQIDWITCSQSHELSSWSWIWREESGSRTHTLSQGQRLGVCPPHHAGARSLPPLLPPPPSPAPGQRVWAPCPVVPQESGTDSCPSAGTLWFGEGKKNARTWRSLNSCSSGWMLVWKVWVLLWNALCGHRIEITLGKKNKSAWLKNMQLIEPDEKH